MSDRTITIATFYDVHDLHFYQARLEEEGIPCMAADLNTIAMNPRESIAKGGARLIVFEKDAERSNEIIESLREELNAPDAEISYMADGDGNVITVEDDSEEREYKAEREKVQERNRKIRNFILFVIGIAIGGAIIKIIIKAI